MPPSAPDRAAAVPATAPSEAGPFAAAPGGVRVHVRLAPGSAGERIGGLHADAAGRTLLKVAVTAAPEAGKANAALIRLLAREWRLPKSVFAVTAGATDRRKVLTIAGETDELMNRLGAWTARQDWP